MIVKQLKGGEDFDFNNVESGMVICEDYNWLQSITPVLEHLGIQVTSYEGTSDYIIKFEKF